MDARRDVSTTSPPRANGQPAWQAVDVKTALIQDRTSEVRRRAILVRLWWKQTLIRAADVWSKTSKVVQMDERRPPTNYVDHILHSQIAATCNTACGNVASDKSSLRRVSLDLLGHSGRARLNKQPHSLADSTSRRQTARV